MRLRDKIFINQYFKKYYLINYSTIYRAIKEPESREFALINEEGVMKRHIAVDSEEEFKRILIKERPRDLYHSTAYYLFPDKPMEQKERRAADLVFDLDADHISGTPVKKVYKCVKCGEIYKKKIERCGKCGGDINEIIIVDSDSIDYVRNEVKRLIDILTDDIGLKRNELKLFFSGGRGFHINISNEPFTLLDSMERLEIKDYISLDGIDLRFIESPEARPIKELIRIYKEKKEVLDKYLNKRELKKIEDIFSEGEEKLWRYVKKQGKKEGGIIEKLNKILSEEGGVGIDGVVTVDTSRLIRAEYSLHGKTGLIKKEIEIDMIDDIDFIEYTSIKDEVYVNLEYIPDIRWGDKTFNETFNEKTRLPITLAIYLLNKGLAHGIERI